MRMVSDRMLTDRMVKSALQNYNPPVPSTDPMTFLAANVAYGNSPILRILELAQAINKRLILLKKPTLGVVLPWVGGQNQIRLIREHFSDSPEFLNDVYLDKKLGECLHNQFYTGEELFEQHLEDWNKHLDKTTRDIKAHFKGSIGTVSLAGKNRTIKSSGIIAEIARSPRVQYGFKHSYLTSFGTLWKIYMDAKRFPREIEISPTVLDKSAARAKDIENSYHTRIYGSPSLWEGMSGEAVVPPLIAYPHFYEQNLEEGAYVTVSGIPGLERLYESIALSGMRLYSNNEIAVPGSRRMSPHIITNKAIKFHFARAGWGSIWYSLLAECPLLIPDFDKKDDPEIFFNNQAVETWGIAKIYRGEPLEKLMPELATMRKNMKTIKAGLMKKFGTLDGNALAAEIIVKDFLKEKLV